MRAPLIPDSVMLLHKRESATTSTQHDANLLPFLRRKIVGEDSGILERFTRRGQREGHSSRHMLSIFAAELGLPVEILHLRGNLYCRLGNVKRLDAAHTTLALLQPGPKSLAPNSDRSDTPHAGDNYAARTFE